MILKAHSTESSIYEMESSLLPVRGQQACLCLCLNVCVHVPIPQSSTNFLTRNLKGWGNIKSLLHPYTYLVQPRAHRGWGIYHRVIWEVQRGTHTQEGQAEGLITCEGLGAGQAESIPWLTWSWSQEIISRERKYEGEEIHEWVGERKRKPILMGRRKDRDYVE